VPRVCNVPKLPKMPEAFSHARSCIQPLQVPAIF
jgi:hypothetical protein